MENNMDHASALQRTATWTSGFHKLFYKFVSSKAEAAAPTTELFCEKWRPAGIHLLLTNRDEWTAVGCQLQTK
jgi:hypothetical protein